MPSLSYAALFVLQALAQGHQFGFDVMLRAPFHRLHFAGEHTNYAFVGYMEGALGSGIAVAKRLAQRDGLTRAA